ncbi:FGGY family carbohydrate kinase [Microbacterium sp. P5_E9]
MTTVLAIDQGTSGTKAVVVAPDGTVLGLAELPVRPAYSAGGAVEHDPRLILESVLASGRAAIAQAGVDVDIVTLANQGETVLAWDPATGAPLTQMIVWQDRRAESVCRELAEHRDEIADRTGLVLDPYFSAPKQAWIRRNLTAEGVVTTSDAWLLHQLTGEFVTDVSTASRSLVTGLDSTEWDAELLALFGLGDERLPAILPSDAVAGSTRMFGRDIPVGGLIVDQQAALLAQSGLVPGEGKCTFGTGAFLVANSGTGAQRSSSGLAASVAWSVGGRPTYCLDGQVYTAASAIRWMENLGFIAHAADLDRVSEPDSAGVFSVPALAGLGAPWWRPDARAALSGMSLSTGVGHIVRAVLEGIAAQVAELGELVAGDIGQPLTRLRVDGGLTRSRVLMQAVADLMQIEVDVYPSAHATPLGAVALARIAYEPGRAIEDSVIAWTPAKVYTPRWAAERAADFRGTWRALAESSL